MTYEEWLKNREESKQSNDADYNKWLVQSGKVDIDSIGNEINERINTWLKNNENYILNANDRFSNSSTSYRSDASDWLSTVTTQKSNFEKEAEGIKSMLDQYRGFFNEDYIKSVTQALDGNLKVQGDVISNSTKDLEYWSQWETEDAYNEWLGQQKDYEEKLNYDLGAGQKEIDWLQSVVDEYDKVQKPTYSNTDRGGSAQAKADAYNAQIGAIAQKYGISYADAKAQLSEKSAYHTLAGRIQKAEELASVADPNSKNYDPAFAEKSQYQSTSHGDDTSFWDKLFKNEMGMGYADLTHEYINGDEEFRSSVNQKHSTWTFGNNPGGDTESRFEDAGYDFMNEKEIALYNYYYNTEGKEKAQEYLDSIRESLQYRYGEDIAMGYKGNPVGQYIFAVESGLEQFVTGAAGMFADEYIPTSSTQIASGMIREDLADTGAKLPDWLGGGSLGQVGYDVLNTTANMLPSILASTAVNLVAPGAGAVVGAGLMGASAGGNAKLEMLNLGYSNEQATSYGLMVGAAEAGMEYLLGGITKLGGKLPDGLVGKILTKVDNAFARTAIKIGGSMASEGLEEGLQTVIEPWLKEIATDVDWDDPNIDEVLYSSLLGALSAFGLEGAGVVAGEVNTYKQGKKVQNVYAGVEKLQNIGSTFSADSVAYKIASKVNAQTDAYTIGRLLNEVGGTISEQNLTDIVNGLTQRGMDTKTATKLAKQYQSILNSEMSLTDEGVKILENLSPLADVLRTNIIGSNTTVYQRTRAYADLMSLANEVTNGKKSKSSKTATTEESSATEETPTNIFEQKNINSELQKMASEVATGSRTSLAGQALKRSVDSASASAAEKLGVEGKYTSSDTGATRLASNKKKVNIVGVDSIEDGAMKLKLDDGSIVDADEIDFSTSDEALVYEAVTNMGVSSASAWEILKGYNPKSGQSGTIYAMGALEAYTYGHNGVKVDGMSKDGFSALLSPTQKNTANRLGDIDARAKVEAKQKTIDKAVKTVRDEARSKHKAIPKRKGEVVFDGDRARLTDLQKSQFDVIEKVAEGLGVTFHIFESKVDAKGKRYYKMPNGKITSASGWYDTKTGEIWIDLYAGNDGQGTMIFTAAHELTHFIRQWSPAKFKVFADFLFEQYGKKGQDVNQLVREQIQKAANNGRSISWDEAYEEVIADSCETFLRDSKASEKIAALREKDVSLANKIKTFLGQMLAKMRKLMADLGLAPETKEGKMVAEMTDSLQKLYDLWTDALADAGTAYSTLANIDLDTESVAPMFSERTWTASEYVTEREETAKKISKALGVDIKTAYKYIDDINSVARLIADDRARLDYEPNLDEHASVLKPNSDYKYSVDMSTLCAKRLLFTGTFDAIQRALPNTVFDSEDIVALREMMQDRGYEVACGICYVESTRREIGRITQDFINSYIESQKTGKAMTRINSEGKAVELKKTKDQKETTADKSTDKFFAEKDYTPTLADLNTTDIDLVKRDHPLVYEAYLNFMNARGQAKPKLLETRAEYKGEILTHFKSKSAVNARNNSGGLRLQSFSDFEVPHLIDMMQIIMDMSRVGLKSQAYTKVPAFAEIFGDTGVKINLSLIAKGDGLDANGNLVFDDVEGINHKEAFKLRDKYSKNVGTILVGKTDAHIIAAMADSRIDYIIPFHKSSWKESLYDALGLTGYADYTDYQNEKPIDKDRKIKNFDPSEYWDFSKSGDENAQIYLEKCREDGRIPKFPQFQGYPGYWKLLIDFKMYDNDGVGSPQEVVRPTFNTEASERILSEYKGGHKSFPVAKDVVEDFVKEHRNSDVLYSERMKKVDATVEKAIKQKGNLGVKFNQERISEFPDDVTAIVSAASDGRIDLTGKFVALNGSDLWHEFERRTDVENEVGRRQIPLTAETIKEAVMAIYEPDVVESLFSTSQNPTQRQSFAYAKKSPNGYYIVVEAVGGKTNPNVVPVEILQFNEAKWDEMIAKGKTLGELLFENDAKKRNSLDVEFNKKNRVIVAQFASKEAIANTPHSPRFTNSIPHFEDSVNRETEKMSDRVLMGSLFSGGGTLEAGLVYQMLDKEFAVEYNKKIAATYTDNHGKEHMFVGDVRDFNSKDKQDVFYLHASPVCKNFSPASHSGGETTLDITTAQATARVLEEQMPQVFTVENVKRYIGSEAYNIIINKLNELGYTWDVGVYKASDYGNATKRERMIIRAVKDGQLPAKPQKASNITSWGEATRDLWETDLIPSTLVRSKIEAIKNTPQLKGVRLTKLDKPLMIYDTTKSKTVSFAWADELAPTLTTKCGDARIIMPDGRVYAPTPRFMGRIQGLPDDYKYPKATTNAFKIIGNGIPTQLTKAVMGGVLDSAYEQTHDGEVLYSDRNYSEGLSEADKEVADNVIRRLKEHKMFAKYYRGYGTYTEKRINHEIAWSMAENDPDYAQTYITWVKPSDYIYATTATEAWREQLTKEAGSLDKERLAKETQPIYLTVDFETGKIKGHEGRHRMIALEKAGVEKVAVIIISRNDQYWQTKPIEVMKLEGQDFGDYKRGAGFFLHNMLPLSERYADVAREMFSFDTTDGVRFSDRSPDSVSTRTLLANALETTAQNDIEKTKLEQYKSKIDLIESEYDKLTELKAKIKELSFAKGARDTKAIKKLQFEANQTANRINVYDRQLLNLESTTALKNVLQREKKMAYDKAKKEGKDALAKQRERQAKTIRTLMDKNTESRKKAIEGRNQTDMRHRIREVVKELNDLLLNPTKDKHIPIGLQKPVASALAVINMDTVGADERIAKYNELISKTNDPDKIAKFTRSRDNIELQGESLKDKLVILQNAYAALLKSDDPLIKNSHNEAIENLIESTIDKVGNTSIRKMNLEQLEAVYDMFKAIKATVRNANKMFKEGRQEIVTDNSEAVKREVSAIGGHRERVLKATKWLKKFGWNMLKPIYAMKLIGSDTLTRLYENVRKGEDTWAVDVNEAKNFFKETAKKYEYNVWDFEKQYKFADSVGHPFSLTLEQIMSLYAYSKRKQADKHLELGGFIFDDSIEVTKKNKLGIPMKYEVNDANPYRLKKEDLAKVIDLLESQMPNVKGFVDEMQAYLSDVMGAKGNEVSLAMYDIKLYKEQNYFPLKSAKYFREFDPEKNGTPKIKNSGFSKNTVPQAGNPIVLSNFMDVWANHVNDMSMYHAFVLPLEDFMRVYNYSSTAGGYDSVQQYIKNAYGLQANTYIETLMNDLNGGARTDPATDLIGKGMSLFKKAAVFASASVVIQQPSAIARAMAYVDAKYFVDKPEATKHSETWAEVKKYAPVAIIKEMGYFDTNMGRSTVDWIKEEKTWRDKVDDIASKAPALADELAWCAIWKAVKREIADSTNLEVGSKEFLKMAGKRFTEVVTKTQVYDSVLSRSALMRSKDSGAKMITAFMAEPTTSLNMVVDAIIEGKRGNKKFAGKVIGAVASSIILNSILVSLVTAARDDDDDETYAEKYLESLTAEMLDGFNPLTYIPLVKDIWSIMQGFDIERSDMSIWSDLWQSVENLFSDNKSGFEKTEGIVGSIASIFGLPLKNLMRDARGIYNLASTLLSGTPTTWAGVGEAVGGAVKDSIPLYSRIEKWVGADTSKSDKLYNAIMSGDQNQIDRVKSQYKDDKAVESAIRQGLRENDSRIKEAAKAHGSGDIRGFSNYIDTIVAEGHFDRETVEGAIRAEESAFNTKVNEAAEAKNNGNDAEYKKIVRELRDSYKGIYSQDEIVNLITVAQKEQLESNDDEDVEEATSIYKASDINDAFESGDTDTALEVIDDLFNTKVTNYLAEARKDAEENGKTFNERKAQAEAESKAKSSIKASMTSYWKPLYKEAYKSGNTAEKERIERILKASGLYGNASEVIKTCREWRTERD